MHKTIIPASTSALDQRSRDIFKLIVENYLSEGEPVGSRNLSRILPQSLSPATIRNVMSDLENLGLIYAPHVSAGRMPTQTGLRFFVDGIMEIGDLSSEERRSIETEIKASGEGKPVENLLTEASQMLSGLSRGAGLVHAAGGQVITEDESTCVVYGMPRSVVEAGLSAESQPLHGVADAIVRRSLA